MKMENRPARTLGRYRRLDLGGRGHRSRARPGAPRRRLDARRGEYCQPPRPCRESANLGPYGPTRALRTASDSPEVRRLEARSQAWLVDEQRPKAEWDPKLLEQLPPEWWPTSEDKGEGTS